MNIKARLFARFTPRDTLISVDIFRPGPEDGELYVYAQAIGCKYIFQCTMHKTIIGGTRILAALRKQRSSVWCEGCKAEVERYANSQIFEYRRSTVPKRFRSRPSKLFDAAQAKAKAKKEASQTQNI